MANVSIKFDGDKSALQAIIDNLNQQMDDLRQKTSSIPFGGGNSLSGANNGRATAGGSTGGRGITSASTTTSTPGGFSGQSAWLAGLPPGVAPAADGFTGSTGAGTPSGSNRPFTGAGGGPGPTRPGGFSGGTFWNAATGEGASYQPPFGGGRPDISPTGPFSSIGVPGFQRNSYLMAMEARTASMSSDPTSPAMMNGMTAGFLKGGLAAVGTAGAEYLQAATMARLSGRPDVMATAAAGYGLAGGLVGAGIGSLFGGFGAIVGAGIGNSLGGSIGRFVTADRASDIQRSQSLLPIAAMSAGLYGDLGEQMAPGVYQGSRPFRNPVLSGARRLSQTVLDRSRGINEAYFASIDSHGMVRRDGDQFGMTPQELAETYQSGYQSLIAAGIDPEQMTRFGAINGRRALTSPEGYERGRALTRNALSGLTARTAGGNLVNGLNGLAMTAISALPYTQLTSGGSQRLYEMLAENADKKFGTAGVEIFQKSVAPILAATNQTGGNLADILLRFGVQSTNAYLETTTPFGEKTARALRDLMKDYSGLQQLERSQRLSSLQARGVGAALERGFSGGLDILGGMPNGRDSEAYAQMNANRRVSMFRAYGEQDDLEFGIPMTKLEGRRARANFMPYNSGGIFSTDLQIIASTSHQARKLTARMASLKAHGDLSEEAELSMTGQIENLRTRAAQGIGELASGGENLLLGMSAGRPSSFGRYDSSSLAAMRMYRHGSPNLAYGSANGRHLGQQNHWLQSAMAGENISLTPFNRMSDLNNGSVVGELRKLNATMEKMAHGGPGIRGDMRPGEARSQLSGVLAMCDLGHANWRNTFN